MSYISTEKEIGDKRDEMEIRKRNKQKVPKREKEAGGTFWCILGNKTHMNKKEWTKNV